MKPSMATHLENVTYALNHAPCNVSGLAFSFAQWMQWTCDQHIPQTTRNTHPITKAYIHILATMAGLSAPYTDNIAIVEELKTLCVK